MAVTGVRTRWQRAGAGDQWPGDYRIERAGCSHRIDGARLADGMPSLRIDEWGHPIRVLLGAAGSTCMMVSGACAWSRWLPIAMPMPKAADDARIAAPMPRRVAVVKTKPGDDVLAGQELQIIEAMKMELAIKSPRDGIVAEWRTEAPVADVVRVAKRLHELGCREVSLGDTIGVGTPLRACAMPKAVASKIPMPALAVHFHDTYGQAQAVA